MKALCLVALVTATAILALAACAAPPPGSADVPVDVPAADAAPSSSSTCQPLPAGLQREIADEKPPLGDESAYELPIDQLIGFVFPNGLIALKAASLAEPYTQERVPGMTNVGIVEVDEDADQYYVAIDLASSETIVPGTLVPVSDDEILPVNFARNPVYLNPERNEPPPAAISVSINAGGVCYVLDPSGAGEFWQYCSVVDGEPGGQLLSVRDRYAGLFEELMAEMQNIAEEFGLQAIPELTISEMEDRGNIERCAVDSASCGADIAGAPVRSVALAFDRSAYKDVPEFQALLNNADENGCEAFPIDVGVVRVYREIPSADVAPGRYKVSYWYWLGGFAGATISGTTDGGESVEYQPIPAVPATFLGGDSLSQISAWRLCGKCVWWQKRCP